MKFVLTSINFTGEIILEFASHGFLTHYLNNTDMSIQALTYWFERMPVVQTDVEKLKARFKTLVINEVKLDLSFKAFWDCYSYKVGKIKKIEELWNLLPEADKLKVFKNIKDYDYFLSFRRGQAKMYPSTYLNQRAFETEWRTLI